MLRQIKRNRLKKSHGNNKIKTAWKRLRLKENGPIKYMVEYNRTTRKHLRLAEILNS